MSLKLLLNGCKGRMGQAIMNVAPEMDASIPVPIDLGDDCETSMSMIGTTGHTEANRERIIELTEAIPIVWAGNYSVGVNLLFWLTAKAAATLDSSYHPEVIEMHHQHKKDAPSGTAENLIDEILQAREWSRDTLKHGRSGITGERPAEEIGVHALRGGEIVGEHSVFFTSGGERLELTHRAYDRRIFAEGAVKAAHWAKTQTPGLYNMRDVLGLT